MTMANADTLCPPNATALERAYAASGASALRLDIPIEDLWHAWRCPAAFLPWLAWALSVDLWDDAWSEIDKRRAVADSPYYHRIKGTRLAVDMAVALLGARADLTEWWETIPPGRRGTSRLYIDLDDDFWPLTDAAGAVIRPALRDASELARRARLLVAAAKPKARPIFVSLGFGMTLDAPLRAGLAIDSEITFGTISPNLPDISAPLTLAVGVSFETALTYGSAS